MGEIWRIPVVFGFAFVLGLSGAVYPGPMFAATVMHSRKWGWRAGVLVSSGHGLLELALLVLLVAGGGAVLVHPAVARTVAVAGGLFLVVLGIVGTVRPPAPPSTDAAPDAEATRLLLPGWWRPFLAGVWTSATQPYWLIWWAFVGASAVFKASGEAGAAGVGAFYVGHVLSDFAWFTFVAAAVGAGRKVLPESAFRKLFMACGVALVGFGVFFLGIGAFAPHWLEP